jgi:XTP/dITP diphosphohydrolase
MKIVLATHNKDKRKELLPLVRPLQMQVLTLDDFPQVGEIVEDGSTLKENALIKARTVHKLTGLPALADDTGLEVDALNGAPGIFSARYAGENCSYEENVKKLLSAMKGVPPGERTARFRTVMAFVDGRRELTAEGIVEGTISLSPKGVGGFGYDPVFYVSEMHKTFAQMKRNEKATISHRGRATKKMLQLLARYYSPQISNPTSKEETA